MIWGTPNTIIFIFNSLLHYSSPSCTHNFSPDHLHYFLGFPVQNAGLQNERVFVRHGDTERSFLIWLVKTGKNSPGKRGRHICGHKTTETFKFVLVWWEDSENYVGVMDPWGFVIAPNLGERWKVRVSQITSWQHVPGGSFGIWVAQFAFPKEEWAANEHSEPKIQTADVDPKFRFPNTKTDGRCFNLEGGCPRWIKEF